MTLTGRLAIFLLISPLMLLALHAVVSRLAERRVVAPSAQLVCMAGVALCNIPVAVITVLLALTGVDGPIEFVLAFFYSLMVFNLLGYSYFHVFNMSETARRIRLLTELAASGPIRKEELSSIYSEQSMFDVRIVRLKSLGQLKEINGRYVLGQRPLYFAACAVNLWARVLGMPIYKSGAIP
ncbi:MAG: hypothetical protein NUW09_03490 [Deltaproteobacteria bacterium]|nr:hypothetical protein [Deltaproteobacteria bacterium]